MADETPSPHSTTRWIETARGVLRYAELAPLLAERVLRVQERIEAEAFAARPLAGDLLCELHWDFCSDLVPAWAGRWRSVAVQVGTHEPPAPHLVPLQIHDYTLDLQVRLREPIAVEQLPESLAFAEGRLLSIHPFADFNGRLARLWLWELLRRLQLPPVDLVPTEPDGTQIYLAALRAADHQSYQPLTNLWMERLAKSSR